MAWLVRRLIAGFRRRSGTALLIAVLAAVVAVVAATTPILTRSVQQAALDHTLRAQPPLARAVLGDATSNDEVGSAEAAARAGSVVAALRTAGAWDAGHVVREQNDIPLGWATPEVRGGQPQQRIADVPSCTALRFTSGACPRSAGDAAVAQSTFIRTGLRLGERVVLKSLIHKLTVRIVGVYDTATEVGMLQAYPSATVGSPTPGWSRTCSSIRAPSRPRSCRPRRSRCGACARTCPSARCRASVATSRERRTFPFPWRRRRPRPTR